MMISVEYGNVDRSSIFKSSGDDLSLQMGHGTGRNDMWDIVQETRAFDLQMGQNASNNNMSQHEYIYIYTFIYLSIHMHSHEHRRLEHVREYSCIFNHTFYICAFHHYPPCPFEPQSKPAQMKVSKGQSQPFLWPPCSFFTWRWVDFVTTSFRL